jgi:GntR family transcriptional regulator
MLVVVHPNSGVPVYRQIIEQVRFHISSGLLGAGDELPSTRALSEQLRVNPMTVSKAYNLLEQEGLLEHRPGLPLRVARIPARELDEDRLAQFRALLEPVVTAARQLGISPAQAVSTLREMILNSPPAKTSEKRQHA